jgi:hypothetical protein
MQAVWVPLRQQSGIQYTFKNLKPGHCQTKPQAAPHRHTMGRAVVDDDTTAAAAGSICVTSGTGVTSSSACTGDHVTVGDTLLSIVSSNSI